MVIVPSLVFQNYHLLTPQNTGWHASDFALGWAFQLLALALAIGALLIYRYKTHT